jgi:hypothetical protein
MEVIMNKAEHVLALAGEGKWTVEQIARKAQTTTKSVGSILAKHRASVKALADVPGMAAVKSFPVVKDGVVQMVTIKEGLAILSNRSKKSGTDYDEETRKLLKRLMGRVKNKTALAHLEKAYKALTTAETRRRVKADK